MKIHLILRMEEAAEVEIPSKISINFTNKAVHFNLNFTFLNQIIPSSLIAKEFDIILNLLPSCFAIVLVSCNYQDFLDLFIKINKKNLTFKN